MTSHSRVFEKTDNNFKTLSLVDNTSLMNDNINIIY